MGSLSRQVRFKPPILFFFLSRGRSGLVRHSWYLFLKLPHNQQGRILPQYKKRKPQQTNLLLSSQVPHFVPGFAICSSLPVCLVTISLQSSLEDPSPWSWLPGISVKNITWRLSLVQHKPNHFVWLLQHQNTPVLARILNKACLWLAACLKKCHFLLKMKWNFVISGLYWAAFIRKWSLHLNENLLLLLVPSEPLQVNII